jgi:hypothetical protein
MKKLIVFVGVLFALTVILESCKATYPNSGRLKRPQRHPRVPRKMAMIMPQQQVNTSVVVLG